MRNRIPLSVTKRVNNWCCWAVHQRIRIQDEQLEKETDFVNLNLEIESTEPQQLSKQDQIIVLSSMPANVSGVSLKIWVKDIKVGVSEDCYLTMRSRKTPGGANLPLLEGYYKVMQSQDKLGTLKDEWLYLFKSN